MNRAVSAWLLSAFLLGSQGTAAQTGAPPDDFKLEEGYRFLFNGKDLTGWEHGYCPPGTRPNDEKLDGKRASSNKIFEAMDGLLVASGKALRGIYTSREFNNDFHLKFEFRTPADNKKNNSGLFLRGVQLQLDGTNAGGLTNVFKNIKNFKEGDWNEIEVTVKGGFITNTVNGKALTAKDVLELTFKDGKPTARLNGGQMEVESIRCTVNAEARCKCNGEEIGTPFRIPATGTIGLQSEIGKFEFRRIRIKEYPSDKPAAAGSAADPPAMPKIAYQENVVYGEVGGVKLLADIAFPEAKESVPAIISVHGGRWRAGDKRDASTIKVKDWAGFGFFAMSINYRLVNVSLAPACYQDVQCAIRYVHAHAKKYNIDPQRIFLIGQSAGGHLVSLAATLGDGPYPRTGGWEKESNDFRAAISVAAAYDLPSLSCGTIWAPKDVDPDKARVQASPVNHVAKESKPILVMHSDNDGSVPIDNALKMVEALKKAGARHTFHRYPKMGHMGINQEVIDKSLAFIKEMSPKRE